MNIERYLRLIGGGVLLLTWTLGQYRDNNFHWLTAFVGLNLFQSLLPIGVR